jgi:hypothetical protein
MVTFDKVIELFLSLAKTALAPLALVVIVQSDKLICEALSAATPALRPPKLLSSTDEESPVLEISESVKV